MNTHTSPWAIAILALLAAASVWLAWLLREVEAPPPLVGPPRSDYSMEAFELIAFDKAGSEAFSLRGPRLARHPHLGSYDVEQPRLRMPDESGSGWQSRADRAFISRDFARVELHGEVLVRGPSEPGQRPLELETASLELFPNENRASSAAYVTITGPGSILRGRGLRAELNTKRVELLAEVTARYESATR